MEKRTQHFHFIGIGGIGMSALAKIAHHQGHRVSGCDAVIEQKSVKDLQKLGCMISEGNNSTTCADPSIDTLVYSSAINKDNPELVRAQEKGIQLLHRSELLGQLMKEKTSIAIAGTHGKTTTSSMLSHILLKADVDPTIIIGGHLNSIKSNARYGKSEFLVAEADESDRSFLNLFPTFTIVTNINFDHAETYKNLNDVTTTFKAFLNRLPKNGKAIVCGDDKTIESLLPNINTQTITYGFSEHCDLYIFAHELKPHQSVFCIRYNKKDYGPLTLPIPGKYNILNAMAALVAADSIGINIETSIKALETFDGVDRRFTFKGTYNGARIIDDYGHHPNEIKNALAAARLQTTGKVRVLFQPHRYSRTKHFWNEFITTFIESDIDELIITDIYPASEAPLKGVTSQDLVKAIQAQKPNFKVFSLPLDSDFSTLLAHCKKTLKKHDLLMLQGAGKVNQIANKLTEK